MNRKSLIAGIALFAASVALAGTATPSSQEQLINDKGSDAGIRLTQPPGELVAKPGSEIPTPSGLTYDLPAEAAKPSSKLTVSVLNGARVYVQETIVLPAAFVETSTIAFLANHPSELARVRKAANARPEALRFTIALDDKVIVNVPFVDADGGSARVAGGSVVGSSRSVTVNLRDPLKVVTQGMVSDPACEADCEQAFYDCYTYCDERGGGCPWCQTQYSECLYYCPKVCVEPKEIYTWKTNWTTTGSSQQEWCKMPGASKYLFRTTYQRRTVYKRTVNCNGTYTDAYQATEQQQTVCKVYVGGTCGFAPVWTGTLPPNCSF